MSGVWHDTGLLLITLVIDLAILAGWYVMGSSLFDRDSEVPAAAQPGDAAADRPPLLHRITGAVCLFLLVGLIVEASGLIVVILVRYGFSR